MLANKFRWFANKTRLLANIMHILAHDQAVRISSRTIQKVFIVRNVRLPSEFLKLPAIEVRGGECLALFKLGS